MVGTTATLRRALSGRAYATAKPRTSVKSALRVAAVTPSRRQLRVQRGAVVVRAADDNDVNASKEFGYSRKDGTSSSSSSSSSSSWLSTFVFSLACWLAGVALTRSHSLARVCPHSVILIGVGLLGGGFFFKWALEQAGVDPIMAGNYAQLIIFVGLCFGWIGSYLFRVATKQMTYAKQLDDYENAVMAKRLEEMPEAEIEELMADIEGEKQRRGGGAQ